MEMFAGFRRGWWGTQALEGYLQGRKISWTCQVSASLKISLGEVLGPQVISVLAVLPCKLCCSRPLVCEMTVRHPGSYGAGEQEGIICSTKSSQIFIKPQPPPINLTQIFAICYIKVGFCQLTLTIKINNRENKAELLAITSSPLTHFFGVCSAGPKPEMLFPSRTFPTFIHHI